MANPSTEGPSGAGTEVLRRKYLEWSSASNNEIIITGAANHIYTILSVSFAERGNASELMNMFVVASGPVNVHIFSKQVIGAYETFVWNDKLVLMPANILKLECSAGSETDYWISYIDQDWT